MRGHPSGPDRPRRPADAAADSGRAPPAPSPRWRAAFAARAAACLPPTVHLGAATVRPAADRPPPSQAHPDPFRGRPRLGPHTAPPLPGKLHLLPERPHRAQVLPARRAGCPARPPPHLRPVRPDGRARPRPAEHRPPHRQGRAADPGRHLVRLPPPHAGMVRPALPGRTQRHGIVIAGRGTRAERERRPSQRRAGD